MGFEVACSSCGSRFSLADDLYERKIKGRIVTIQCRRCGHGIGVDGTGAEPKVGDGVATTGAPPIAAPLEETPTVPLQGMRPSPAVPESPKGGATMAEDVWLVSYGDDDDRELTVPQLRAAIARGEIDVETIVWKDGMDDWVPLGEVAALRVLVPSKPGPQAKPAGDAPAAAKTPPSPPAAPKTPPSPAAKEKTPPSPAAAPKPSAATPTPLAIPGTKPGAPRPVAPATPAAPAVAKAPAPKEPTPAPPAVKAPTPPVPPVAMPDDDEAPIPLLPESVPSTDLIQATPPARPPGPPPRGKGPVALGAGTLLLGTPEETQEKAPRRMPQAPKPPSPTRTVVMEPKDEAEEAAPESMGTPALATLMHAKKKGQASDRASDEDILGFGGSGMSGGGLGGGLVPPTIDLNALMAPPVNEELPEVSAIELSPPSVDAGAEALESSPVSSRDPHRKKKKKKKRADGAPDSIPAEKLAAPEAAAKPAAKPAASHVVTSTAKPAEQKKSSALVWLIGAAVLAAGGWFIFGRGSAADEKLAGNDSARTAAAEPTKPAEPAVTAEPVKAPAAEPTTEPTKPAASAEKPGDKPAVADGTKPVGPKPEPGDKPPIDKPPIDKPTPADKPVDKPVDQPKPVDVAAGFDTAAARTALASAAGQAAGCRKGDDPSGVAQVAVTFAPSGRVTSAVVQGKPYAGTATGGCIASAMRSARVPAFSGERVTVGKRITVN